MYMITMITVTILKNRAYIYFVTLRTNGFCPVVIDSDWWVLSFAVRIWGENTSFLLGQQNVFLKKSVKGLKAKLHS